TQSENGKYIGRVDNKGLARDRQHGGNGVGCKQQVGSLHHKQYHRERGSITHGAAAHKKLLAFVILGHAKHFAEPAQKEVGIGIHSPAVLTQQLDAAVNEDRTEDVDEPAEPVQQRDAGRDEDGAHDERAHHAPEQHVVLQDTWHSEVSEEEQKYEQVVDTERKLDQITGDELQRELVIRP